MRMPESSTAERVVSAIASASGPLRRTMPTPPSPGAVAIAAIVSDTSASAGKLRLRLRVTILGNVGIATSHDL